MKILVNALVVVIAAALGLSIGFALRGKIQRTHVATQSRAITSVSSAVQATQSAHLCKPRSSARLNDDSPLATKLERDLSMSSGVTRWLYRLEAIEKATLAD